MQNKFKKMLLSIGTLATVAMPISAVVSCGDSTNGEISESDREQADKIINPIWEKSGYKIGKLNSSGYNDRVVKDTENIGAIIDYLKAGKDAKGKTFGTLEEEWNKILPKTLNHDVAKKAYEKLVDDVYATKGFDYGDADEKNTKLFTNLQENNETSDTAKARFDKYFWNDKDLYDLQVKDNKKKYETTMPAHSEWKMMQYYYADFLRKWDSKAGGNDSLKQKAIKSFIYRFNEYFNRGQFTYPAVTGAGFSSLGMAYKDKTINPFSINGDGMIIPLLRAVFVKPDLTKGYVENKNEHTSSELSSIVKKDKDFVTYQNSFMKEFVTDFMDNFTSVVYFEGEHEFDNWWTYEKKGSEIFKNFCLIMAVDPDYRDKIINKWSKSFKWFAGDPLYQHASEGAIYNSVPAPKLMNSGANLFDYAATSISMDLVLGDIKSAKKHIGYCYNFLVKDFAPTYVDGYKADGGFLQHNNIPYQNHYGEITISNILKFQNTYANTPLDLFANYSGMQNIYKILVNSYLPVIHNNFMSQLTMGRFPVSNLNEPLKGNKWHHVDAAKTNEDLEDTTEGFSSAQGIIKDIIGLLPMANKHDQYTDKLYIYLTDLRRNSLNTINGYDNEKLKKDYGFTDELLESTDPSKSAEQLYLSGKTSQIWSEDILIKNHDEVGTKNDWNFQTRFHDNRVGFYEGQLGNNLQGITMGDGMQLVRTGANPGMYNSMYWAAIDPYHAPGTIEVNPQKIPDPDIYFVPGMSQKPQKELRSANYNPVTKIWKLDGAIATNEQLKQPNEWTTGGKSSSWSMKVNLDKNDATGQGFSGGVSSNDLTTNMNYSSNWNNTVTQRRSVFTLDNQVFVMGQVQNPKEGTHLTIDNRRTFKDTGRYTNTGDNWIYNDTKSNESIGYSIFEANPKGSIPRTATSDKRIVGQEGSINTDVTRKWSSVDGGFSTKEKAVNPNGYYNRLTMDLSQNDSAVQENATYAYSIMPGVENSASINKIKKDSEIKIIRNDQNAQIISYKAQDGGEYLMANVFENNNFNITIPWFDEKNAAQPIRLTATQPTSFIFKKTATDHKFEVTAQSALHNSETSRIGFGKRITNLEIPFGTNLLFKEQEDPQYWTDKQKTYQNGPLVQDLDIKSEDWFKTHSKARVTRAKDLLTQPGKVYERVDQLDLIPDERFQLQDPFHFYITIEDTQY